MGRDKVVIKVCGGKSCKEHDAKKLREELKQLSEDTPLSVRKCGCLGECGKGIVVEISPGKHILKKLKPDEAQDVFDKAELIASKK
mgnify:CR=1 FL=1